MRASSLNTRASGHNSSSDKRESKRPNQGKEKFMSTDFASAGLTAGQLNAIVKDLGGHEMALRFLRGELIVSEPSRRWWERDDVIRFSVTSDGTTGEGWIARLRSEGFAVVGYAEEMLRSKKFRPTSGVITEIAVVNGKLFSDEDRRTGKICIEARNRGLIPPHVEVACLIREKFTDEMMKEVGFREIVTMHEPMPYIFHSNDRGYLEVGYDSHPEQTVEGSGFAFALPTKQ